MTLIEEDKTVCQGCGYEHLNTQESSIHLKPGNYCPKCGKEFEEGDRFIDVIEI